MLIGEQPNHASNEHEQRRVDMGAAAIGGTASQPWAAHPIALICRPVTVKNQNRGAIRALTAELKPG